jgi:hypothetical protein
MQFLILIGQLSNSSSSATRQPNHYKLCRNNDCKNLYKVPFFELHLVVIVFIRSDQNQVYNFTRIFIQDLQYIIPANWPSGFRSRGDNENVKQSSFFCAYGAALIYSCTNKCFIFSIVFHSHKKTKMYNI